MTLGIMQYRNANLEEADSILQSAINSSVEFGNTWFEALAWHAIALVKTALGELEPAIHSYLRAVELAPDQIFPWNNLGSLYENIGDNEKAVDAYQKAIKINPDDATSWDGLGDVYTKMCRFDEAIAAYQLANVFERKPKGDEAIKTYEKAFEFYNYTLASFENAKKSILRAAETYQPESTIEDDIITFVDDLDLGSESEPVSLMDNNHVTDDLVNAAETGAELISEQPQLIFEPAITEAESQLEMTVEPAQLTNEIDAVENSIEIETVMTGELVETSTGKVNEAGETAILEGEEPACKVEEQEITQDSLENSGIMVSEQNDVFTSIEDNVKLSFDQQVEIDEAPLMNEIEAAADQSGVQAEFIYEDTNEESEPTADVNIMIDDAMDLAQVDENEIGSSESIGQEFETEIAADLSTDKDLPDTLLPDFIVNETSNDEMQPASVEMDNEVLSQDEIAADLTADVVSTVENMEDEEIPVIEMIEQSNSMDPELLNTMIDEQPVSLDEVQDAHQVSDDEFAQNSMDTVEIAGQSVEKPLEAASEIDQNHETAIETSTVTADAAVEAQPEALEIEAEKAEKTDLPPVVVIETAALPSKRNVEGTIASFEAVVKQNPKNDRAWVKLGTAFSASGRHSDAAEAFERAVTLKPRNHVYHFELGTALAASGNLEAAIGEIEKVLELEPAFMAAHCTLAGYFRKLEKEDESRSHIEAASEYMCSEKEYDRACFESICGNIEAAIDLLSIALQKKQTSLDAINKDLDLDFIRNDHRFQEFVEKHTH
ncbi:MAG: tetratricopeptide repeat protein [Chloroflexota bacterium]